MVREDWFFLDDVTGEGGRVRKIFVVLGRIDLVDIKVDVDGKLLLLLLLVLGIIE